GSAPRRTSSSPPSVKRSPRKRRRRPTWAAAPLRGCSPTQSSSGSGSRADLSFALRDRERPKLVAEARAAHAGAGRRIESGSMGLAFDLASRVEESSVTKIHRLGAVRADVHPGADGAVRRAIRESLLGVEAPGL